MKFNDSRWNDGFGTYQLRGEACTQAVYHALKIGHRLIDTATIYRNHADVGRGIALAIKDGLCTREDICVVTKVANTDQGAGPNAIVKSMHTELRKLGLEYVDVLLLHGYLARAWEAAWQCLQDMRDQGLCRHIGVSNYYEQQMHQLLESPVCRVRPCLNQIEISPFHYPRETITYCQTQGVVVQAHTPLIKTHKHDDARVVSAWKMSLLPSVSSLLLTWCAKRHYLPLVVRSSSTDHQSENWTAISSIHNVSSPEQQEAFALLDAIDEVYVTHPKVGDVIVGAETKVNSEKQT